MKENPLELWVKEQLKGRKQRDKIILKHYLKKPMKNQEMEIKESMKKAKMKKGKEKKMKDEKHASKKNPFEKKALRPE